MRPALTEDAREPPAAPAAARARGEADGHARGSGGFSPGCACVSDVQAPERRAVRLLVTSARPVLLRCGCSDGPGQAGARHRHDASPVFRRERLELQTPLGRFSCVLPVWACCIPL